MKLFRLNLRKKDGGVPEGELVLDTEAGQSAPTEEAQLPLVESRMFVQPSPADPPRAPAEAGADLGAPAPSDVGSELQPEVQVVPAAGPEPAGGRDSLMAQLGEVGDGDEGLDPELLDIFREAKNEAEESSLAAELEEVPIGELLSDLRYIGGALGVQPRPMENPRPLEGPQRVEPLDLEGKAEDDEPKIEAELADPDARTEPMKPTPNELGVETADRAPPQMQH